ncbi:NAD(P)/FAD-dependent oxidoreductase [Rhodopila globiformis]|uniref:NAD(P)/FAD-dependent oxidoreductase n=1 Tax=Rhodopila globiformis TaxID=1071 RepID=UPI001304E586|nr:FAD-dependent monooxygenase [Rhodopila globiformis]
MACSVPAVRREPLIIGAGPAGCAAAITLARAGCHPVLIERASGPADKVCGDFLSADTIGRLRGFGVDPAALGGSVIGRVRLIHRDRVAEAALPFPALGLSRRVLDDALLRQASQAGAKVLAGRTVRHLTREFGAWSVEADNTPPMVADAVFLATGKHDLRDVPRPRSDHDAVGMKMYFILSPAAARRLGDATELTLFPGGYAGLQAAEDGRAVLCVAVRRAAFQGYGGGWTGLLAAIGRTSGRFPEMLAGAIPLLPRPLAVAGIPYGYQVRSAPDGLFRLGDQAAVIPSLTGDGMAIALHSGQAAARAWLEGAGAATYHRALNRTLAPQMGLARGLHSAMMDGLAQGAVVQAARLFPGLLRQAARHTRLRRVRPCGFRTRQ